MPQKVIVKDVRGRNAYVTWRDVLYLQSLSIVGHEAVNECLLCGSSLRWLLYIGAVDCKNGILYTTPHTKTILEEWKRAELNAKRMSDILRNLRTIKGLRSFTHKASLAVHPLHKRACTVEFKKGDFVLSVSVEPKNISLISSHLRLFPAHDRRITSSHFRKMPERVESEMREILHERKEEIQSKIVLERL